GPLPRLRRTGPELRWPPVLARTWPGGIRREAARAVAEGHRPGDLPVHQLPAPAGPGDAVAADRAAHHERASPGRVAGDTGRGGHRPLCGPAVQPVARGSAEVPAPRRWRGARLRAAGRGGGGGGRGAGVWPGAGGFATPRANPGGGGALLLPPGGPPRARLPTRGPP